MRRSFLIVPFALALVFAACGSDDGTEGDSPSTTADAADDHAAEHAESGDHDEHAADDPDADATDADHVDTGDMEGMDHGEPAVDDKGLGELVNGHHSDMVLADLSADEQAALDAQLAITREVAATYPTVADATAAGYRRAGPYSPGLGTHYTLQNGKGLNVDGIVDDTDLREPLSIIYTGSDPDDEIAGFMYYSFAAEEPVGFVGTNDFWHYHTNVCIKAAADGGIDSPFGADAEVTEAQCAEVGGSLMQQTQWMVHVWTVPGWEVSDEDGGTFAEVNPGLACPDGTYYRLPVDDWAEHPLNVCKSEAA